MFLCRPLPKFFTFWTWLVKAAGRRACNNADVLPSTIHDLAFCITWRLVCACNLLPLFIFLSVRLHFLCTCLWTDLLVLACSFC